MGGDRTLISKPNNLEANKKGIILCIYVYIERGRMGETEVETEKEG